MELGRPTSALLVLTFVTGVVDAASFLGLGQVFAAMQTGNVIFLGLGLAGAPGAPLLAPLISLAAFLLGGLLAALAARRSRAALPAAVAAAPAGAARVDRWLALEASLLASAAVLALLLDVAAGAASAYCVVAVLALTMGLRNAAVRGSGGPNLATTVLNLSLTNAVLGGPLAAASQADLRSRGAAFAAILAGAVAGGLLATEVSLAAALLLAVLATLAAIWICSRRRPPAGDRAESAAPAAAVSSTGN